MTQDQNQDAKLLEEVSNKRKDISPDRMDISFNELINMYNDNELIIKPEYQRFFRWSDLQKTTLIESLLLSIPIPPIFVAEDIDTGKWELVDGLQRISTIVSFFGKLKDDIAGIRTDTVNEDLIEDENDYSMLNKWTLVAGRLLPELEGYSIDNLPNNLVLNIKRAACRVEILRSDSSHEMKYELFRRLNSGGSHLTAQEVRNAIYRGTSTVVNELLVEAAADENFINLTSLSTVKKRELYDQELVLRFFAFSQNVGDINQNTENFLNHYMNEVSHDTSFSKTDNLDKFKSVFNLLASIEDEKIFRNDRNFFVPAWFEGISISVANNLEKYEATPNLLKEKINTLKSDNEFKRMSGSASNSRSRIKKRLGRALEIFSDK